jgi:RNA polymerase sigma factor (sigma-70 family)
MGSNKEKPSDEELILLYRKEGDLKILGRLYDPYMGMVYGVCLKYLKDREESKDAVMQIFEKLVTTLKSHEVTHFRSWLYVTARNFCLMQIRSSKSRKFQEIAALDMENGESSHHEDAMELELNMGKLEKCIEELANEQQQCVRLFYIQQKCYKEITVITGFEDNKVKSYIQNGKRNLKICMERNA